MTDQQACQCCADALGLTDLHLGHELWLQLAFAQFIKLLVEELSFPSQRPQYFFAIRICLGLHVTPKQSVHFPFSCKAEHLPFFVHLQVTSEQCINASASVRLSVRGAAASRSRRVALGPFCCCCSVRLGVLDRSQCQNKGSHISTWGVG